MRVFVVAALATVVITSELMAVNCAPQSMSTNTSVSTISLNNVNVPDDNALVFAADFWNGGCGNLTSSVYPGITFGNCSGSTCLGVTVVYQTGYSTNSEQSCGDFQPNSTGGTITMYEFDGFGSACSGDFDARHKNRRLPVESAIPRMVVRPDMSSRPAAMKGRSTLVAVV